jgi:hypothetical protein
VNRISMAGLVLCCLALVAGSVATAGINSWTETGPGGGEIRAIASQPGQPNTVLATALGGRLYRSANGGASWQRWPVEFNGEPNQLLFDPADATRVFVVANFLYRSQNTGTSFDVVAPPGGTPFAEIAFATSGTLFGLRADDRLFRSDDHAESWVALPAPPWATPADVVSKLTVDPDDANRLFVYVRGVGIYRSIDGGMSWIDPAANGPGSNINAPVNQIVIKPGNGNIIQALTDNGAFFSIDAGLSWTVKFPNLPCYTGAFDPLTTNNFVMVCHQGVTYLSADSGEFTALTFGEKLHITRAWGLKFEINGAGKMLMATTDGPMISNDSGASFDVSASGIHVESLRSVSAADDGTVYAIFNPGPNGIYRRSATGYDLINFGSLQTILSSSYNLSAVVTAAQDSALIHVLNAPNGVLRSTTSGNVWSVEHPTFYPNRLLSSIVRDPSNPAILYVGTNSDGVWRTTDDGLNWSQRSATNALSATTLTVDPANPDVLYAGGFVPGTGNGVYKSVDGGVNWNLAGSLTGYVSHVDIDPSNSNIVYASLSNAIYKSTNAGGSWSALNFTPLLVSGGQISRVLIDPVRPTTLFGLFGNSMAGFARSVDGGTSWETTQIPPNWQAGSFTGILDPHRPNLLIAGGNGTGVLEYEVAPNLIVEWGGISSPVAAGATANAAVTVRNAGPHTSSASEVTVAIPAWMSPTVPAGCAFSAPTLRCTLGAIRVGDAITIPVALAANQTLASGVLTASVAGHETDQYTFNNTATLNLSSTLQTDLALAITTATPQADHGEVIRFVATATNRGPSPSPTNQVVLDLGTFTSPTLAPSTGGSCTLSGHIATCNFGALAANAAHTVTVDATASEMPVNSVNGTFVAPGGSVTAGLAVPTRPVADLAAQIVGPAGPITSGTSYQYTITVRNNGPDAAPVGIHAGFDRYSTTAVTPSGASCSRFTSSIECPVASLPAGATVTIVVDMMSGDAGTELARVFLVTPVADRVAANNEATATTTVRLVGDASVMLVASANPVTTNTPFTFTASVANAGPNESVIRVQVPVTGATVTGVIGPAQLSVCNSTAQSATCEMRVASGASANVVVNATPATAGTASATATVTYTGFDPVATNDSATTSITVNAPPAPPSSGSSSGGGGGGRFDWLAALLLGAVAIRRVSCVRPRP